MNALTGWPFWAPSDMEAVEHALDLAEASPGDHVVDLGCGDGQVLVAAAQRGCVVTGVECDAELAEHARQALDENNMHGNVVLGDVFDYPIEDADVVFTYLAPATLQRLVDRFQAANGTRLVTVDFEVPGLEASLVDGRNHLYRLPAAVAPNDNVPAWQAGGILVAVTPDRHSLTCLLLHHPGGAVDVAAVGDVASAVTVAVGTDAALAGEGVAVDLRWEELAPATFWRGALRCTGLPDLGVFALVTEEEEGLWEVTEEGIDRVRRRVEAGWAPSTFAELVAACDADD